MNRLLLKFVMLWHVGIQEISPIDITKFNNVPVTWESKKSLKVHFLTFREPKIQNLTSGGHHLAVPEIY